MAPHSKLCLGLLAFTLVLAAPAAHAFTLQGSGETNSDGSAKYTDPDTKYGKQPNKDGTTTLQLGSGTIMTLGPQRNFNSDFDAGKNRMLSPFDRDR